jgi:hypothetical protein
MEESEVFDLDFLQFDPLKNNILQIASPKLHYRNLSPLVTSK